MSDLENEIAPSDPPKKLREGLPIGYRMRADSHYVEQLTSDSSPLQVRLIALSSIEEPVLGASADLAPLIESIRANGIVQPLLLTTVGGCYRVIAGAKRFFAARAAGLAAVPALVHPTEPAAAAALAQADNLRCVSEPDKSSLRLSESPLAGRAINVLHHVWNHLAGIAVAQQLLVSGSEGIAQRAALDIVRSHVTRCRWLIEAVEFLPQNASDGERQTLGALTDALVSDFAAEGRLTQVSLRVRLDDRACPARLNKQAFRLGMLGALFALLPFAEAGQSNSLTLTASRTSELLSIEIVQRPTIMDEALARSFFESTWSTRPGGWPALLGALALKTAVEREGGSVQCSVDANGAHIRATAPDRR